MAGLSQSPIREVTGRIEAVGGINLGQGTCALPPHPAVLEAAHAALEAGHNSYTHFEGIPSLKDAIIARHAAYSGLKLDRSEVLVTQGATGGLECACKSFLDPGDECVLFAPIYEYHVRLVRQRGALPRFVRMRGSDWRFDVNELEAVFNSRTKLVVLANPSNPTGKVFRADELQLIGEAAARHNAIVVVDEVYEYLVLNPAARHISLATLPGMFDRTLTLSSASKTFSCTGWRVGWCIGPDDLIRPLGIKSDETYICAPAPLQHAVAQGLRMPESYFDNIRTPFVSKCERLCGALGDAGFALFRPEGAFYVFANYRPLGFDSDMSAMNALIDRIGIGTVPGCAFYPDGFDTGMLRFCFAVEDDRLDEACSRLRRL